MDNQQAILNTINEAYTCISGENGAARNMAKYATLFMPEAKLNAICKAGNSIYIESKSLAQYIDYFNSVVGDSPFYEKSVANRIECLDSFAIVWSNYEVRISTNNDPLHIGTNCFQLFFDQERWLIISILWERKVKKQDLMKPLDRLSRDFRSILTL